MPMYIREVPVQWSRPRRAHEALLGAGIAVIVVVAVGLAVGPTCFDCNRSWTKLDVTQDTVMKYAYEAYPAWAADHPGARCPRVIAELNAYMTNKDTKDPWGTDYRLACDGHPDHLVVASAGPDGLFGTADDLPSK